MLGYLDSSAAVGQFSVAQKLPIALLGVVQLWSASLYPQAARMMSEHRAELRSQVSLFTTLGLALGLPLAAGAVIVGPGLVTLLFGSAFAPAGRAFVLVMCAVALSLLTVSVSSVLAAGGHERRYAVGRTLGAVASIAGNAVAIPLAGVDGAAATMVFAEFVVLIYMLRRYQRVVGPLALDIDRVLRAVGATAIMAGAVLLTSGLGVGGQVALGIAVYAVAGVVTGLIRREELRQLLRRAPATAAHDAR
jgi:O-antigen/teichoic acid export membrane protein